jgi:thiol-disulfide isomerase/thioredoxin
MLFRTALSTAILAFASAWFLTCGSVAQVGSPKPSADETPAVSQGKRAPPLHLVRLLQAPADAPRTLDKLKGKAVVLEFWFTACGPCVAAFPHFNELVKNTSGEQVVFISITDDPADRVAAFLEKNTLATWVGIDDKGATTSGYSISAFPTTVLIDPDGVVQGVTSPENVTAAVLKDLANRRPLTLNQVATPRLRVVAKGGIDLGQADVLVYVGAPNNLLGDPMGGPHESKSRSCSAQILLRVCYQDDAGDGEKAPRVVLECDIPEREFGYAVRVPKGSGLKKSALLKPAVEAALGFRTCGTRELRDQDVFVLKHVGPDAPAKAAGDPALGSRVMWPPNAIIGEGTPVKALASWIERETKTPVMDDTGLSDSYDWQIKVKSFSMEDLNAALKEIGLAVSRERRKVEYVVVRRADDPAKK